MEAEKETPPAGGGHRNDRGEARNASPNFRASCGSLERQASKCAVFV